MRQGEVGIIGESTGWNLTNLFPVYFSRIIMILFIVFIFLPNFFLAENAGLHSVYICVWLMILTFFCRSENPPAQKHPPVAFFGGRKWEKVEENSKKNVDERTLHFRKHFFQFLTYFFPPDPEIKLQPMD